MEGEEKRICTLSSFGKMKDSFFSIRSRKLVIFGIDWNGAFIFGRFFRANPASKIVNIRANDKIRRKRF